MTDIAIPNTLQPKTTVTSAGLNANFSEVQSKFNTYAMQTNVPKTVTQTHTYTVLQLLQGGATLGASGTLITQIVVYAQTITPASVAAATVAEQTFTVTGLTTADKVVVNHAATGNATGIAGVRVSAANTLAVSYVNPTAGALVPAAGTYLILAFRS